MAHGGECHGAQRRDDGPVTAGNCHQRQNRPDGSVQHRRLHPILRLSVNTTDRPEDGSAAEGRNNDGDRRPWRRRRRRRDPSQSKRRCNERCNLSLSANSDGSATVARSRNDDRHIEHVVLRTGVSAGSSVSMVGRHDHEIIRTHEREQSAQGTVRSADGGLILGRLRPVYVSRVIWRTEVEHDELVLIGLDRALGRRHADEIIAVHERIERRAIVYPATVQVEPYLRTGDKRATARGVDLLEQSALMRSQGAEILQRMRGRRSDTRCERNDPRQRRRNQAVNTGRYERSPLRKLRQIRHDPGVGGSVRPPKKVTDVRPSCPSAAATDITVRLTGRVTREGTVADIAAVPSAAGEVPPQEFVAAAADAVREWKFTPTLLNGQAVEVGLTVEVKFVTR